MVLVREGGREEREGEKGTKILMDSFSKWKRDRRVSLMCEAQLGRSGGAEEQGKKGMHRCFERRDA